MASARHRPDHLTEWVADAVLAPCRVGVGPAGLLPCLPRKQEPQLADQHTQERAGQKLLDYRRVVNTAARSLTDAAMISDAPPGCVGVTRLMIIGRTVGAFT